MYEILILIVVLIIIALYVVFFIGMHKAFTILPYSENGKLKNYLIWFTVLFVINVLLMWFAPTWWILSLIIFIVLLILIWFIYNEVKGSELKNYFLPLAILYTIFFVIGVIAFLVYIFSPDKTESFKTFYNSYTAGNFTNLMNPSVETSTDDDDL